MSKTAILCSKCGSDAVHVISDGPLGIRSHCLKCGMIAPVVKTPADTVPAAPAKPAEVKPA